LEDSVNSIQIVGGDVELAYPYSMGNAQIPFSMMTRGFVLSVMKKGSLHVRRVREETEMKSSLGSFRSIGIK
jgi:hypothetical protein